MANLNIFVHYKIELICRLIHMKPQGKLKIMASPKKWQGIFSNIHICQDEAGAQFLFKEVIDQNVIFNELVAHRLAPLANVNVLEYLEPVTIENRTGLAMSYLKDAILPSNYKRRLSQTQHRALQKIVLFDLWIGNRDRHTANILIKNGQLIAFDHEKILLWKEAPAIKFIKLNLGLILDPRYLKKLTELQTTPVQACQALVNWFGFNPADLEKIQQIKNQQIFSALKELNGSVFSYLCFRRDNLAKINFC